MSEVRYQMLRPEQIVARRKECPVVYIPLGTLERHGDSLLEELWKQSKA